MNPSIFPTLSRPRGSFREIETINFSDSDDTDVEIDVKPVTVPPKTTSSSEHLNKQRKRKRRSGSGINPDSESSEGFLNRDRSPRIEELNDMANIETVVEHSINHISDDNHEILQPERSKPIRRQSSYYTPNMEDKFRRKLKYFFMDPCSKWKAKRRFPWKLCLQIIKIIIITAQVVIFAGQRSGTVDYFERNKVALKHIFLKNWDAAYETMPYPPAVGNYAVYTKQDLIEYIDHIMEQYYRIPKIAIGTFFWERNDTNGTESMPPPIEMCKTSYNEVSIFENKSFIIDPDVHTVCFPIEPIVYENKTVSYDIVEYLREKNLTILFSRLIKIELNMAFRSYHLDLLTRHTGPACFKTQVEVLFDNNQRNGQTLIDLTTQISEIECNGKILSEDVEGKLPSTDGKHKAEERGIRNQLLAYDSVVMCVVILSTFLCIRSIVRAQKLRKATVIFFTNRFGKQISLSEQLEFLNLWYVLIVINDMLTLAGSCFKIMLESKKFTSLSENYDLCSILLGVGSLLAWCGVLRYLGFFAKYNILIVTLKTAFPNVLRFMVCALILYLGFMFCGWVILGPYHIKFRHLSTTSECLFSLVNGDDMFVTFSATQTTNNLVWYFSRAYLYIFISLFIYIVLSLFIAVIMDTYETLKKYWENGFPKSDLFTFIEECNDLPSSGRFDDRRSKGCSLCSCFPCFEKEENDFPTERTALLNASI